MSQLSFYYLQSDDLLLDDFQVSAAPAFPFKNPIADRKFEKLLRFLPFSQQTRIISKKDATIARITLINQLLQRYICCRVVGKQPHELEFTANQYGKPFLKDSNFQFSMSNSSISTSMVVDFDNKEVGIDLADTRDVDTFGDDYLNHFRDIFHPNEFEYLKGFTDNTDQQKLLFTQYWALKESYTKKLGVGLNGDLASYNFRNVEPVEKDSVWNCSTKLFIYDNLEKDHCYLVRLENIIVSIIADTPQTPTINVVSLQEIISFFEAHSS